MSPALCRLCRGHGEVARVRMAPCCSGRNAWGEVVCGCNGLSWPEEFYVPCPAGCSPASAPDPLAPCTDPYCW